MAEQDLDQSAKDSFFEFLRTKDCLSVCPEKLHGQIKNLLLLSEALHELARMEGGLGYRPFHNAHRLAVTLDYAVGTLRRVDEMHRLTMELREAAK